MSFKARWASFMEWVKQAYYLSWLLGLLIVGGGFVWRKFQNSPSLSTAGLAVVMLAVLILVGKLPDLITRSFLRGRERMNQRTILEPLGQLYVAVMKEAEPIRFSDVEWEVRVNKDFGVEQFYRWTWVADTIPVFAKSQERGSDVPVSGLSGIDFEAKVIDGNGVVLAVPADDTPTSKGFLLFPVPALKPDGNNQRVEIRSTWPKACRKLAKLREWDKHSFLAPRYLSAAINRVQIRVLLPDLGYQYEATEEFNPVTKTFTGLLYEATVTNVTAGTKLAVKFRRIK